MRQAVILAAGSGRRLNGSAGGGPKCLVRVGELSLIERQIQILNAVGIDRIAVVVGYRAEEVRSLLGTRCEFIHNERYAQTNSLFSLSLTRDWVTGPFVLMNCDVLAHPDIYHRVLASNGSALAYDGRSGEDDEHMKVSIVNGLVRGLSKQMPADDVCGENVGVIQFDEAAAHALFRVLDLMVKAGADNDWAPAAVSRVAKGLPIRAVNIAGLPWTEIDFPEDLTAAGDEVLPTIELGEWVIPAKRGPRNGRPAAHPNRIGAP